MTITKTKKNPVPAGGRKGLKKIDVIAPTIPNDEFDHDEAQTQVACGGLPWQAFAIVGDKDNPCTWKLPHHTRQVYRAIKGKVGYEHTVDWENMPLQVAYLSRQGVEGQRVIAEELQILAAAAHLASHYRKAGKPIPDALAVLT
jgi:hypothetical protein